MTAPTPNDRLTILAPAAGTTLLSWDFRLTRSDALTVVRRRAGAETTLVLGVDYTLPGGLGTEGGGTLTLAVASLADDVFILLGLAPLIRVSDFVASQAFDTAKQNADLDYLTHSDQEQRRDIDRAWKSDFGALGKLIAIGAVGSVPMFDASGNLIEGPDASEIEAAQGYANAAEAWADLAEMFKNLAEEARDAIIGNYLFDWADWDGITTYDKHTLVFDVASGRLYRSLQDGNLNKVPASEPTWWKAIFVFPGGVLTSPLTTSASTVSGPGFVIPSSAGTVIPAVIGGFRNTGGNLSVGLNTGEGLQLHTFLTDRNRQERSASSAAYSSYNNALAGKSAAVLDDTLPLVGEVSDALVSISVAAKGGGGRFVGRASGTIFAAPASTPTEAVICLFADTTCFAAQAMALEAGEYHPFVIDAEFTPGDFTSRTYSLRIGTVGGAGNIFFNGNNVGRLFGGSANLLRMRLSEIF